MRRTSYDENAKRSRSLSETLAVARAVADKVGITRLGEVTGLDRVGVPVFQAVRPLARSLSVSQGKGLTRRAAMVSALLESIESHVAENVQPLDKGDISHSNLPAAVSWGLVTSEPLAVIPARDLLRDCAAWMPWDLVNLDFTRTPLAGAKPSSIGLATGNNLEEATVSALAELLESVANSRWEASYRSGGEGFELEVETIDDPDLRLLLGRIHKAGIEIKIWDSGRFVGIPAFSCLLFESDHDLSYAPAFGSGCHPVRSVAVKRAILEAVQVRVTMISGARDDIIPANYEQGQRSTQWLRAMSQRSLRRLSWHDGISGRPEQPHPDLEVLKDAAARDPDLSEIIFAELPEPDPALSVVKILSRNLMAKAGAGAAAATTMRPTSAVTIVSARKDNAGKRLFFVGPSWPEARSSKVVTVLPPVACGDLAALLSNPPEAVAIVDGYFENVPSVWHKEILALLAAGTQVFGAASLGALRAAELDRLGMIGVGDIYEAYASRKVVRDDAVMVVHAPPELHHRPVSTALVEAERWIDRADLSLADRRMLQRIVRTLNFRDRHPSAIISEFRKRTGRNCATSFAEAITTSSVKRQDAMLLFERLSGPLAAPAARALDVPQTIFFRNLVRRKEAEARAMNVAAI